MFSRRLAVRLAAGGCNPCQVAFHAIRSKPRVQPKSPQRTNPNAFTVPWNRAISGMSNQDRPAARQG